jgi:hypothetical protein
VQTIGLEPTQTPFEHLSVCVQASPSLHKVSLRGGLEQTPPLHVPAAWHWSLAVQTIGLVPVQTPFMHLSVCVQASPSLQGVSLSGGGSEQTPSVGLHVPAL